MSWLFASGGQIGASALTSAPLMNIQGWLPLGLMGLISLQSKGLSRVFSSNTIWKHQFFSAQPSLWSNSYICTWLLEKPWLWLYGHLSVKWCLSFLIHCLDDAEKCCTQYVSKFGKLSSGHRTGKGWFSSQSRRRTMTNSTSISILIFQKKEILLWQQHDWTWRTLHQIKEARQRKTDIAWSH